MQNYQAEDEEIFKRCEQTSLIVIINLKNSCRKRQNEIKKPSGFLSFLGDQLSAAAASQDRHSKNKEKEEKITIATIQLDKFLHESI